MNIKTAAAILAFLCMLMPRSGLTAERKSDLRITYTPPSISVEAQNVSLLEVLRIISLKVGFDLANYSVPDRSLTVSIQEATVEDVLRQLLGGENYCVIYLERERAISKVLLLASPVYAHEVQENQQARIEVSRAQEGLTIFPAAPSYQPVRSERKQEPGGDNEPRVEDILRLHAMPGVTGSGTFPQGSTPDAPHPLGGSTSGFPLTGSPSPTTRSLDDMNDSLTATTRLAQQNLKGLVDGLATATHSLRNSSGLK